MTSFASLVDLANRVVWGPWDTPVGQVPGPLFVLLFGMAVFLTVRLRFVQLTHLGTALRTGFTSKAKEESGGGPSLSRGVLTPFQAFASALAASIGMGNIAGVATAVVSGGPGAVFWIWCYGLFAAATKFSEAVLGIKYRHAEARPLSAGPPYYIRDGLGMPRLAWVYALVAGVAALTTTPGTQPNSIAVVFASQFNVPPWITGIVLAVLAWLVIIGGITSIGRVMQWLAPAKVFLYVAGGLVVLITHAGAIPSVLATIVREAFSLKAATGGSAGIGIMVAMRYGLARGVYANEAGYGTAAVMYGTAKTDAPERQGLNAALEVFVISFITSSMGALAILVTGVWRSGLTSTAVVAQAFDTSMPGGGAIVAICAFLFGYTALTGWAYYGEQFLQYIFGPRVIMPYRWLYCLLIPIGAIAKVDVVWAWGDLMNGLQVFPNVVGLIGLSGVAAGFARRLRRGR
ncbi:MAG: alanine/glycine:cation symporter family protein [Bacteroidales bacterium]